MGCLMRLRRPGSDRIRRGVINPLPFQGGLNAVHRGLWGGLLPPPAPTGVAVAFAPTSLSIIWSAVAGATSYNLYRGTTPGGETLLTAGVTSPSVDSTVTGGTTYYYKVTAVNAAGEGAKSSEVSSSTFAGLKQYTDFSNVSSLWQDTGLSTQITADGQTIKGTTDLSGVGNSLTNATGCTYKTLIKNSLSVGRFNGSTQHLLSAGVLFASKPYTLLIVFQISTNTTGKVFMANGDQAGGNNGESLRLGTGPNRELFYAGVAEVVDGASTTNWEIWTAKWDGSNSTLRINGVAQSLTNGTSVPATPTEVFSLGSGNNVFGGMDCGEAGIYNVALSDANIGIIESYLNAKWVIF